MEDVKIYTKDDFLNSTKPFEDVYKFIEDRFTHARELEKMSEVAKAVGVRNFKALYKDYTVSLKTAIRDQKADNVTNFDGQELELETGGWIADDYGITKETAFGEIEACVHPILPVRRLVNVDSGIEKLKIAFRKGRMWRSLIAERKVLASSNKIVELADYGVSVTSENAKWLVKFIHDIENLNYERIPEFNSVARLGWISGEGFSPYVDSLVFDGDVTFKHFFESVREQGSYKKWIEEIKSIRRGSIPARIMLAAAFASVLVEPCNGLPFFVHLWGGTETGKTVALMLAASVWANPEMGKYIHTFNSTQVAQELSAGFVNSLPLILDELQIVKDKKDFDNLIYQLSEGVGRMRGQKTGGLQKTVTWNNCILTTGEQPISTIASGGGVVNRIIQIDCESMKVFKDPVHTVEVIRKNYGFAGKIFVEKLQEPDGIKLAREVQKTYYKEITDSDTTEKQALAASLILAADALADLWIFNDNKALSYEEITPFLSTKAEVSVNQRAYDFLFEWIAQNRNRFDEESDEWDKWDCWGKLTENSIYIIRSVFNKAVSENGYNPTALLSWLKENGKIEVSGKAYTKSVRINKIPCHCVCLNLENEQLPMGFELLRRDEEAFL